MTTSSIESRRGSVRVTYCDRIDSEIATAFFGPSMISHRKGETSEHTTLTVASSFDLESITIDQFANHAVLNFVNRFFGDTLHIALVGIPPEALCDAVEAARLQEIAE